MHLWIITVGEPLPLRNNKDRLHRTGILSEFLIERGHKVLWWSSTFNHFKKQHHFTYDVDLRIKNNFNLVLLHGPSYRKNISVRRISHNISTAKKFRIHAWKYPKPDLILCSFPTIELTKEAIKYGKYNNVPVIVDVRDLWPDIFWEAIPRYFRTIGKLLLQKYIADAKYIFKNADSITGVTEKFVDWGIKLGKRRRTKNDRSFFLGYKRGGSTDNEIINAGKKWDALGIVDDKFIISYVGAITNNKLDIGAVISAAKQLANMYPDIIFVICGEGDQKDHFESISSKNILYPGWVNNLEIQSLMKRSSLGLVPIKNRFDFIMSIPNKPIEYLSFGVPVITSLRGELSKLIDYYNIGRVYTNEIDVLSNLLLELKSKPMLLNEMSVNAKNLFEKKFKAETVFKDFSKYLENYSNEK